MDGGCGRRCRPAAAHSPSSARQRGDRARERRCAVQVVAGIGHAPRVVGAEGVARRGQAGSRRDAERREDDRDSAPRARPTPRCVNAPAAESRIGQWRTPYPDAVARPRSAHLGGGSSARAGTRSVKSLRLFSRPRAHEAEWEERAERQGGARPSPSHRPVPSESAEGSRRLRDESTELSPPRQYRLEVAVVLPLLAWSPGAPACPFEFVPRLAHLESPTRSLQTAHLAPRGPGWHEPPR